jgi:hypothetical protein
MDAFDKALMDATEQGSAQWKSDRIGRFTASEIYKLMGESRSKAEKWSELAETYILEKIAEEITGEEKYTPDTFAMAWGKEHEPIARDLYAKLIGAVRIDVPGFQPYVINGVVMGGSSPDGKPVFHDPVSLNEYSPFGLEIKCPNITSNHIAHLLIKEDEYFKKYFKQYYYQCQMGMLSTGLKEWTFLSYHPLVKGLELFRYSLRRNDADCEAIHHRILSAWTYKEEIKSDLLKL